MKMRPRFSLAVLMVAITAACLVPGCARPRGQAATSCRRIISLAPSITETLFALGCGDRIVGVTDFCDYPPQVKKIQRVGGYIDPNFEAILSLKPDVAFLLKEHEKLKEFFAVNHIRFVEVDDHDIKAIISSFRQIGRICGREQQGESLAVATERELHQRDSDQGVRPRILFCVGRDNAGAGSVAKIWAAGRPTFYDELIRGAGGINVIADSSLEYPTLSAEGILRMNPDIIIDAMSSMAQFPPEKIRHDWDQLGTAAVNHELVFCVAADYVTIPGPRIILLLSDLRSAIKKWRDMMPRVSMRESQ